MMRYILLPLLCLALLLGACGLRRSNPLDPAAHDDLMVPERVINIGYMTSGAGVQIKTVSFEWTPNSQQRTDGYYLDRSMGYKSDFARVDTVLTNVPGLGGKITCIHGAKPWHQVMAGDYYYKVSAWKTYGDRRLEGPISDRVFVRIPAK